jgi:hypothetical protein
MDYIFKEWEEKLKAMADSVEKDLKEIRKCKADVQQMKLDVVAEVQKGRYVRDNEQLIISAPRIILGNVDRNGTLKPGASEIIIRGTQVGVEAAGEAGQVAMRAASIRQTAEDPGVDGLEHVVGTLSEIISQARHVAIHSHDAAGAFSSLTSTEGTSGVLIHADQVIKVDAAVSSENREKELDDLIKSLEDQKKAQKETVDNYKESFGKLSDDLKKLIEKREKLTADSDGIRADYIEIHEVARELEITSTALTNQTYAYIDALAELAETNRQLKCFKEQKDQIKKGDEFKKACTGASVEIVGENISLASMDGDGNLRDNKASGISLMANEVDLVSIEKEGKLKENGKVKILARNVEVSTAGETDQKFDDEKGLTDAKYEAEGDFIVRSKNITLESMDYEIAEQKRKEKQLTADGKIKFRSKTIELSTENSADVEVDDKGKLTKATYTSEGDIIVRSKTLTVESADYDLADGETKEKALTKDSKIAIRSEVIDLSATDTEGKATGSVNINAKAVGVKAMDVEKEKRTDDKLAADGSMVLVAEKMYVGAKTKDIKSKKLQAVSEEMGLFADKTFEAQQGEAKAIVQLADGKLAAGSDKNQICGDTEVKGEVKAPKATIDNVEVKSAFKSPNISDGMAAGGGGGGSVSAKLKTEDAPEK